jgi:hypothetical protein
MQQLLGLDRRLEGSGFPFPDNKGYLYLPLCHLNLDIKNQSIIKPSCLAAE